MRAAASPAADALPYTCVSSSSKTNEVRADAASRHWIPRTACNVLWSVEARCSCATPS
jgi:hypothetical protein